MFWYGTGRFVRYGKRKEYTVYDNYVRKKTFYVNNAKFHMDEVLADESLSGRAISNPDGIVLVERVDAPYGDKCYDFGSGRRLTVGGTFSFLGDFAIELSCFFTAPTKTYNTLFEIGYYYAGMLLRPNNGNIGLWINGSQYFANIAWQSKWYSIILQRKNGVISLIIDKVVRLTVNNSSPFTGLVAGIGYSTHSSDQRFSGFMDSISIFDNIAPFSSPNYEASGANASYVKRKIVEYGLRERKELSFGDNYGLAIPLNPVLLYDKSKLLLWLDSFDVSTLTIESNRVREWRDKSGNNNHFTQNSYEGMPKHGAYMLGEKKLISIDAGGVGMYSSFNLEAPYSIVLFSRNRAGGRVVQSSTTNSLICPSRGGNAFYVSGDVRFAAIVPINTWNISTLIVKGAPSSEVWYKGVNYGSGAHYNWGTFILGTVGMYNENPDCEILSVLVFRGALNATELSEIEGYLAWNYYLETQVLNSSHEFYGQRPLIAGRRIANEVLELNGEEEQLISVSKLNDDIVCDEDGNALFLRV